MKKWFTFLTLAALVNIPLLNSCDDFGSGSSIDITVGNLQTYQFDFGVCGDEDGVSITKMAEHYSICEIVRDSTTNFCCYLRYKPAAGYAGSDYIEAETNTGNAGSGGGTLKTIEFNITVTN